MGGATHLCHVKRSYNGRAEEFTVGFKLKVVKYAENSGNRSAGRKWGINEKLVHDWRKKAKLTELPRKAQLQRPGVKEHWPEFERKLEEWMGLGL